MRAIINITNIIALITTLITLLYNKITNYSLVFVLPFLVFILNIVFYKVLLKLNNSYIFYIIYLQIFIRYIIIPLSISITGEQFYGFNSTNTLAALILVGFELICIYIVFSIIHHEQYKSYWFKSYRIELLKGDIVTVFILITMLILILSSGYLSKVSFIWELEAYIRNLLNDDISISNPAGVLFSPFKSIFSLLIISLILKSRQLSYRAKLFLSFVILFLNSILIVGVSRLSIVISVLPLLFILLLLFKTYSKGLITGILVLLVPVILITSLSKFSRNERFLTTKDILKTSSLNAYFSGIGNVAVGIDAFDNNYSMNHLSFFINDVFQNVPILSKLTNLESKTLYHFNKEIYKNLESNDQIVPLAISGIFHFNLFGGFLYGPLFVLIAFLYERKFYRSNFIGYKYFYIYLSIFSSLVFMLNFSALIATFLTSYILLFLPMFFIYEANRAT